jgi:hypothetical protein
MPLLRFSLVGALLTSLTVANVDPTMAYHGRYWLPLLPLLCVLAVAGFTRLWTMCPWGVAGGGLLVALLVGPRIIGAPRDVELWNAVSYSRGVKESHLQLALWLRENTAPDAVVAVGDVGLIGYVSQRPILDLYGLNDAFIATHASGTDVTDYVYGRRPDFIVRSAIDAGPLWVDMEQYELVGRWDGHYPMWLFRRK